MSDQQPDVVVIGAGMTGLACARQLTRAGLTVLVLEKSRGLGGRLATRRVADPHGQVWVLDHGVQYFSADTDSFHRLLKEPLELGIVTEWTRWLHTLTPAGLQDPSPDQDPRYVCPDGMTALAKYLAQSLPIRTQARVTRIQPQSQGWHLVCEDGYAVTTPALVVALPAPQVVPLLAGILPVSSPLPPLLSSALYHPCLAVLAGYADTTPAPDWKGIRCHEDKILSWISLDSSKRPHPVGPALVIHTTPEYSRTHLETDADGLERLGREVLFHAAYRLGASWIADPLWLQVHRWRYSLPVETLGMASVGARIPVSPDLGLPLVCAGDWCGGARIEGAWVSGQDAAERLLELLGSTSLPSRFAPLLGSD